MNCEICTEEFNKSTRKQVVCICISCALSACVGCHERYLLSQHENDPHCMKCKLSWDDELMFTQMSRKFLQQYKEHTKDFLVKQERSYIPETQLYLQYDRAIHTNVKKELFFKSREIRRLGDEMHQNQNQETLTDAMSDTYESLRQRLIHLTYEIDTLNRHIYNWEKHLTMTYEKHIPIALVTIERDRTRQTSASSSNESCTFIHPCVSSTCNGFVMMADWKCSICQIQSCKECHQQILSNSPLIVSKPHECNEDDKRTVTLIMKTSKACPSCSTRIFKVDGCDQMWCVLCKTAFSWKTGSIERGAVHNPHFFEWFRNNNNLQLDETLDQIAIENHQCDGLPNAGYFIRHCGIVFPPNDRMFYHYFTNIYRICVHIQHVEITTRFMPINLENRDPNLDLRLKWLKNEIDDKHFGSVLHKRYKLRKVNIHRVQVYEMFVLVASDIFHRLLHCNEWEDGFVYAEEFTNLIQYVNQCFAKLAKVYAMKMPFIEANGNHGIGFYIPLI
jgi:hypothetical protein